MLLSDMKEVTMNCNEENEENVKNTTIKEEKILLVEDDPDHSGLIIDLLE